MLDHRRSSLAGLYGCFEGVVAVSDDFFAERVMDSDGVECEEFEFVLEEVHGFFVKDRQWGDAVGLDLVLCGSVGV